MFEILYRLFIAFWLFGISFSGLIMALSMWRRSVNECKRECCQDD